VLAAALALVAPAPAGNGATAPSGIRGIVTLSGCPGPQRPGELCTKRFEGARIRVVRIRDRRVVRLFRSHAGGRFRVRLSPGRYRLEPQPSGIAHGAAVTVAVRPHRFRYVHLDYDNGLR